MKSTASDEKSINGASVVKDEAYIDIWALKAKNPENISTTHRFISKYFKKINAMIKIKSQ
jgi:hypothetical protein